MAQRGSSGIGSGATVAAVSGNERAERSSRPARTLTEAGGGGAESGEAGAFRESSEPRKQYEPRCRPIGVNAGKSPQGAGTA